MKNKVVHILSKHISWSSGGNLDDQFTIDELLDAMPEIFKLVGEEQKKKCCEIIRAEYLIFTNVDFLIDQINESETVKFE